MPKNDTFALGLLEATHLTRAGRLIEATAAIQRALGHEPGRRSQPTSGRIIEGAFSRVERPHARERAKEPLEGPRFVAGSYANEHGARPYKLYIPSGHAGKARPLLVMLHGCTQTPDDFAAGTCMNAVAEERQCFVLYPAQTQSANRSRCWNWFKRGNQRRDKGEAAIIAGMTREVASRHSIDARKVYVAGLSAGGAMAAVMAATYPDLYAAVGIHSGLAVGSAHDIPSAFAAMRGTPRPASLGAARAVQTIVFHGDQDTTVHPRNGEQVVTACLDPSFSSANKPSVESGRVPGGHSYTRTVYSDATGRILLEHWLVYGAGHAWSGGSPRGSYTDPKGPDAARAMIRFFLGA